MEIGFSPFEASQQCELRDWVFNVQLAFSDFGHSGKRTAEHFSVNVFHVLFPGYAVIVFP